MLDAYIIDRRRDEANREYERNCPRVEIEIPGGTLIDDRRERYEKWREGQAPKTTYDPTVNLDIDLNIAMPVQSRTLYTIEARL